MRILLSEKRRLNGKTEEKTRNSLRIILILGIIWGLIILIFSAIREPSPENWTLLFSILASGLYTVLLFMTRKFWMKIGNFYPQRKAFLLAVFNAAVIETLFWGIERFFGATGVAASQNLLLDLLLTMPWYMAISWSFIRGFERTRFRWEVVLLLGALYEVGGDGIVGGLVVPAIFGNPPNFLEFFTLVPLLAFWQFIPVYSSIVLPPTWYIRPFPSASKPSCPWWDGLSPLLWIFPFIAYLVLVMIIMAG